MTEDTARRRGITIPTAAIQKLAAGLGQGDRDQPGVEQDRAAGGDQVQRAKR